MMKLIKNEFIKIKKSKILFSQIIIIGVILLIKKIGNYDIVYLSFRSIPFIGIIVSILFGGIISSEIENGTFRFYLTKPYKRWKIYLSKLLVIYLYIAFTTVLVILVVSIVNKNIDIKYIEKFFIYSIPVFFIGSFTLFLSTKYRNQSLVVGISIFVLTFSLIISQLFFGININIIEYTFLPYLDYSIFDDIVSLNNMNNDLNIHLSLSRGIVIDSVFIVIMYIIGNNKFNKKDIKN